MKKHILTILTIGFVLTVMFASVQTVYADDGPKGCIAFTSGEPFTVSLGVGDHNTWGTGNDPGLIQFSKTGTDWEEYTAGTEVEAASSGDGYRVFFRGEGNAFLNFSYFYGEASSFKLSGSGPISCSGNIENLLDHTKVERDQHPKMGKYAFVDLFSGCESLIKAPELPAETLAEYCYYRMFKGCTGLEAAPDLPATTLADHCYGYMFEGCTGLTTAPKLPATTLADNCYEYMFEGCTGLTTAPDLPATTLVGSCYRDMFADCTGLTTAPDLRATTLADHCYAGMFWNCTGLTTAPELPVTTLADACYAAMFGKCAALKTAPDLPATELAANCYDYMFGKCEGLTKAPDLPATSLADGCYHQMFEDCTGLTAAPELPATTLANGCYEKMFWNCTGLTEAPELPATTLAANCYKYMFRLCTGLTTAPDLPAMTLASGCYQNMFLYCSSLTEAPKLPATRLADFCYCNMFEGCRGLTEAPDLPATTLADYCYFAMFAECVSLTEAPDLPATELSKSCYFYMFSECTGLTEASALPATTLAESCYQLMFDSCSSLTIPPVLPAKTLADRCYNEMFVNSGIKLSEAEGTVDGVYYGMPYRIPEEGDGTDAENALIRMFSDTAGTFQGTPGLEKTYYLAVSDWAGCGTEEEPYVISDDKGWNTLATIVKVGYSTEGLFFKLGDNIEVTSMVGTNERPFSGSFDGDGHTLTFTAEKAPRMCAPFAYVKDASFKNLHITGTIITNQKFAAGLIGHSEGIVNVTNCRSSVTIDSGVKGDGTHGGFIAVGEDNGAACFEGCSFDGKLLGTATIKCGGFIGWADPTDKAYSVKDCLFAPQELTIKSDMFNFIRNAPATTKIQNSYYTMNKGDNSQGKAVRSVTADEGITIVKEKTNEYDVSKIIFYKTGLVLEDAYYVGKDDVIQVTIPSACDGITASAGTLAGEGKDFTLTMPDQDVTLTLNKGANHIWGKVTYTWNEDNSKVKAERTCTRDGCGATEEETVSAAGKVTKDPTCLDKGETTYTSEAFKNEAFEVQKQTLEDVPATGHAWSTWKPLDENQHQRVCGNDPAHTEEGDHTWDEGQVTKEPTPEETGEKTFTCGICQATRIEVIPREDVDPITPSDETADETPVDPSIPVIDAARITTVGNFARKEMKIVFPADAAVTNYRIQYRMAGETEWKSGWTAGTDNYLISNLEKASLCEFRICGFVKLADGSWVRNEWSDIAYRYMKAVKVKSAKAGKGRLTVRWKKDKKSTGYQIKYFTNKKIHMADAGTITVKGKAKTRYTIKKLQKGTYYVRVRPVKVVDGKEYLGILKNTKKAKVK